MRRAGLTSRLLWLLPLLLAGGCPKQGQQISLEWLTGPDGPKLAAMATDKDDPDRRREGISKIADKDWGHGEPYISWYADCLKKDKYATVRCAAARALGKSYAMKYLPVLVAAMNDPSPQVRCDVAIALARVRGEEAVDALRRAAAGDGSPDVRAEAAKTLRYYPAARVPPTLVYCLTDDVFEVRNWAHDSLVEMTGKDYGWEPADWKPVVGANIPLHGPQWRRPWWDWFGTSKPEEPPSPAASQPGEPVKKPWWDWAGVTRRSGPPPAPQPASAPATTSAPS